MTIPYVIYDADTGRIQQWGDAANRRDLRATVAGRPFRVAHGNGFAHHVVGREVMPVNVLDLGQAPDLRLISAPSPIE